MKNFLRKIFGGLNMSWPVVIIMTLALGLWTTLMALLVPETNSFHDIAVTVEWWILPTIIIIVNCKTPLDAALKVFVFFLISQPLVYLIQVPFNSMGWGLFRYYPYWFKITLATFPGAFIGWYIKKDTWYSGLILSVMTVILAIYGVKYAYIFLETPPNHLISVIYCFATIIILIFGVFKNKIPRIITSVITISALLFYAITATTQVYETYDSTITEKNNITFVGEPYISFWTGERQGEVVIIKYDGGYNFKLSGVPGTTYHFAISDDENEYKFKYYYDKETKSIKIDREN